MAKPLVVAAAVSVCALCLWRLRRTALEAGQPKYEARRALATKHAQADDDQMASPLLTSLWITYRLWVDEHAATIGFRYVADRAMK